MPHHLTDYWIDVEDEEEDTDEASKPDAANDGDEDDEYNPAEEDDDDILFVPDGTNSTALTHCETVYFSPLISRAIVHKPRDLS